ncbi:MAG: DUF494 domain-containing protein [Gammaproteobacteria bacterium]|nr:DUF494 domain-containing protein [Gammaproteobacteria bacterium]MYD76889.1 DUF494 domain-containing protein [Gammaproteobacteria bacterium]MYJ51071.1 DUF494 domain-containing protein [Gammaproteobacteria bacterium]
MRNSILDVLMYLFEDCHLDSDDPHGSDQNELAEELIEAGFDERTVTKAFDWLENLAVLDECGDETKAGEFGTVRHYTAEELWHLSSDTRGYIMQLEQSGILDTVSREMVISQLMGLEPESIELDHVKWVVLVVLSNYSAGLGLTLPEESMVVDGAFCSMH